MFNTNLSGLRRQYNLTQEELATKLNVTKEMVSKWENGEVVPDSYNLVEISKFFNVKVQDLIMSEMYLISQEFKPKKSEQSKDSGKVIAENRILANSKRQRVTWLIVSIGLVVLIITFFVISYVFKDDLIRLPSLNLNINDSEMVNENSEPIVTGEESYTKAMVSAGRNFSVYMDNDGKLTGYGDNEYQQLNFSSWTDLKEISAGGFHTLGLRNDGTVLATGYNEYGQLNVKQWSNVDQISAGRYHSLGLRDDGTVLCTGGEKKYAQCDVSSWKDIFQVSAGRYNSYGLRNNGTVITTSDNSYGQANISSWNDIIQVSSVTYHVLGLKSDGTVECAGGQKGDGACNISSWSDIVQVVGAGYHSIGLKKDGTVVAVGNNEKGQLNVSNWSDIISISGGRYHTIGLTNDYKLSDINNSSKSVLEQMKEFKEMLDLGIISSEEFDKKKKELLNL